MAQIPTPDFAVPYAAPKQVNTMAAVHPMAPKNGYCMIVSLITLLCRWDNLDDSRPFLEERILGVRTA